MPNNPYAYGRTAMDEERMRGPQMPRTQPGFTPQPGMGISPLAPTAGAPQAGSMSAAEQAQIAALLSTYGDTQEIDALEKQLAAAEALRMGTPEGRQAGRVYVAANPLEHIGKGIGDYKLMKKRQANEAAQAEARKRISTNVGKYGELATKDL